MTYVHMGRSGVPGSHTIIGSVPFHFCVRAARRSVGIRWFQSAMVARQTGLGRYATRTVPAKAGISFGSPQPMTASSRSLPESGSSIKEACCVERNTHLHYGRKLPGCYMVRPHGHTHQCAKRTAALPHLAYQRRSLRRAFRELEALVRTNLGRGFPLRCLQRLSCPIVATRYRADAALYNPSRPSSLALCSIISLCSFLMPSRCSADVALLSL